MKDDKELQKAVIEALLTELSELEEEIQVIDAEILTLKEENAKLNAIIDSYQPRLQKYKDILQEIKTIVYARCDKCKYGKDGITCKYKDCGEAKLHLISKLITKAEEE